MCYDTPWRSSCFTSLCPICWFVVTACTVAKSNVVKPGRSLTYPVCHDTPCRSSSSLQSHLSSLLPGRFFSAGKNRSGLCQRQEHEARIVRFEATGRGFNAKTRRRKDAGTQGRRDAKCAPTLRGVFLFSKSLSHCWLVVTACTVAKSNVVKPGRSLTYQSCNAAGSC